MLKAAAENKEADKREREIFEYSKELGGLIVGLKEALREHKDLFVQRYRGEGKPIGYPKLRFSGGCR